MPFGGRERGGAGGEQGHAVGAGRRADVGAVGSGPAASRASSPTMSTLPLEISSTASWPDGSPILATIVATSMSCSRK